LEVIERYAALGGTAMSLGSDAHSPQYVGSHFADAVELMRRGGIKHLAVFREGVLEELPLFE
jgi:histidinol-phosphatase (PHP family)